ncbi:MAG: hypothetical protein Kow0047_27810 [Anaerolineae bacterium]
MAISVATGARSATVSARLRQRAAEVGEQIARLEDQERQCQSLLSASAGSDLPGLMSQLKMIRQELEQACVLRARFDRDVEALEALGVPDLISYEEFMKGRITRPVVEAWVDEAPVDALVEASAIAEWLQRRYPTYWQKVQERLQDRAEVEREIHDHLSALSSPPPGSPRRWFLVRSGQAFRKRAYLGSRL